MCPSALYKIAGQREGTERIVEIVYGSQAHYTKKEAILSQRIRWLFVLTIE